MIFFLGVFLSDCRQGLKGWISWSSLVKLLGLDVPFRSIPFLRGFQESLG